MIKAEELLSRRKLLVFAGLAGTAASAALMNPLRTLINEIAVRVLKKQPVAALRRWVLPLAEAGYDDWLGQVGTTFTVGGGISLKLAGVRAFAASGTRAGLSRDRAFVAMLDVQNRHTLATDLIYTVTHPTHGPFQVFLSAATDARTPGRMLAVFN